MSDVINTVVVEEGDELPDEDVLVEINYSTLNYKYALAVSGKGRICRKLPMICGIDEAGK